MSDLTPTSAGALSATPLPNLLAYLLDHRLSGSLVLEDPAGNKHAIWFERGYPAKAQTAEPVVALGQMLVEMGLIDHSDAERAAERAVAERRLYGVYLVASGAISRDQLELALREQLRRRIRWLFRLPPESIYGFYDGVNLLDRWGGAEGTPVGVLSLAWEGIRDYAQPERVQATLERLADLPLRLHREAQVGRFQFDGREQALADVLRAKPQTLASLLATRLVDEMVARRMIYMLAITRHLDLGTGGRPIGVEEGSMRRSSTGQPAVRATNDGVAKPAAPAAAALRVDAPVAATSPQGPAASPGPEIEQLKSEYRQRAAELAEQNAYQILGLEQWASAAQIQATFFQLAKKWHPDRLGPEFDDVRELVTRAFSRMSEAHALLSDLDQRREYDQAIAQGSSGDEQEQVARALRAASAHQRAEILLKRNQLDAAEREAKVAMDGDPDQSDHLALYAWIVANKPDRAASAGYDDLIALLNRAVEIGPKNENARFWRGQVLKRAGRLGQAIKDFRWVAQNNPRHVDAAREIRLFARRRGESPEDSSRDRISTPPRGRTLTSPGPADKPGFFGKLFKR
jgi:curved DNA-binding protein CbpA